MIGHTFEVECFSWMSISCFGIVLSNIIKRGRIYFHECLGKDG